MSVEELISLCEVSKTHSHIVKGRSTHNRIITEPWSVHERILIRQFFENILLSCST